MTIKQVAREAGVSIATVSRVLNGKGPVLPATRDRIREVARRLRYVPHGGARSLITRRTNTVGVLLPDLHGAFYSELIRGLDREARRRGYHLLVSGSHGNPQEMASVLQATRGRVDGMIVMAPALGEELPEGVRAVRLGSGRLGQHHDSFGFANRAGAAEMVRHLAAAGRRRIAFVQGPPDNVDARERLQGYRAAIARERLPRSAALEIPGDFTEDSGAAAVEAVLSRVPRPDAVFAANDAMAVGVLAELRSLGIAVPGEIAVVGFDDIPLARYLTPSLTTVRVPLAEMAARALSRLLDRLDGGTIDRPCHVTLPVELVVRESCGAGPDLEGSGLGAARSAGTLR